MTRPRSLRAALAIVLAVAAVGAPTTSVLACSCAGFGSGPADIAQGTAASGGLGFIGTVVGTRPAPPDPNGFGDVISYAFEVERATAPVAATIEVRALNDPGGASCGFVFGMNEEWFVAASSEGSALHTGLCHGNQRVDTIDAAAMEPLVTVLSEVPAAGDGGDTSDPGPWLPIAALAAIAVLLAGVMIVAFRRDGVS